MAYSGPERRASQDEVRDIITATIHETLATLGLDVGKPFELQEDMSFLRRARVGTEGVRRVALTAFITTVIPAILFLIWKSIRA